MFSFFLKTFGVTYTKLVIDTVLDPRKPRPDQGRALPGTGHPGALPALPTPTPKEVTTSRYIPAGTDEVCLLNFT